MTVSASIQQFEVVPATGSGAVAACSWRDADLTNSPLAHVAADISKDDADALIAQIGRVEWNEETRRVDLNGDGRVNVADYTLLRQAAHRVELDGPAPQAPGDTPNAETCFLRPAIYDAQDADSIVWRQVSTPPDPPHPDCERNYATGAAIPMGNADFDFDGIVNIVEYIIYKQWYNQSYNRNIRHDFERVNWFRDDSFTLEDWIRFKHGKDRCDQINDNPEPFNICQVCDDDETTINAGLNDDCCSNTNPALPQCN